MTDDDIAFTVAKPQDPITLDAIRAAVDKLHSQFRIPAHMFDPQQLSAPELSFAVRPKRFDEIPVYFRKLHTFLNNFIVGRYFKWVWPFQWKRSKRKRHKKGSGRSRIPRMVRCGTWTMEYWMSRQ